MFKDLKIMKTNIITINTIMTKATKYICAVVMLLGMSVSAWGAGEYDVTINNSLTHCSEQAGNPTTFKNTATSTLTLYYTITSGYTGEGATLSLLTGSTEVSSYYYYWHEYSTGVYQLDIYLSSITISSNQFYINISCPTDCTDPSLMIDPEEKDGNYGTLTTFDISVLSSSSGTITWSSTNTDVATVSGDGEGATVTIHGAGMADIVCSQAANGGHCAGEETCTLLVNAVAPTVSSNATGKELTVSSITSTGATFSGGVVTNKGGLDITRYGFTVGTSSTVVIGGTGANAPVASGFWNDDITLNTAFGSKTSVSNFSPNTTYYVRAFAYNGSVYGYSTAVQFKTLKQYSIDLEGGDGSDGIAAVDENSTTIEVLTTPSRDHYTLEGYYTTSGCTTKIADTEGELVASITVGGNNWTDGNGKWIRDADETFYAKWTPVNYTISFIANGGTGSMDNVVKAYNTTYDLPACGFTAPEGKVFKCWTQGSTSGTECDPGDTHTVTGNVTFYAKWKDATYTKYTFACAELALDEPANDADNVLRDTVYLTSTSGQKVRSLATFHVTGTGLTANKEVKFTTGDDDLDAIFSFKDGNGNAISTNASGAVDADVYIFYQPAETSDGRDIITAIGGIRAYVERNADGGKPRSVKNTARTINGRHLPSRFIIAAKSGGVWYALPSDASVTGAQMGYTFTPDNATTPTKANVAPQTALYTIYAVTADATNPSYVRIASTNTNKTLWSNNSTTIGIKDNALIGGGSAKGNQYEWKLENTGADSYKLYNNASYSGSGRYLGLTGTKWNVFATGGGTVQDLKILSVDAFSDYIGLSATDWEETAFSFNITSGTPPTAPSLDHIQVGYNGKNYEASISGSKLTITDAAFVTDGGFGAASGSQLLVEWCNDEDAVLAQGSVISPIIISSNTVNLSDYDTEALAGTDIFITNGAKLTISENTTVHDVTVNSGATLFVNETDGGDGVTMTLSSGKLALKGGWNSDYTDYDMPRVYINPLSSLTKTNTTVNFDISVDSRNYYPFAVPFPVAVSAVDYVNQTLKNASIYGTHYVIKEYDGAARAENGPDQNANWKIVEDGTVYGAKSDTLRPGKGYIMTAVSIPAYGGGVIRFPMSFANAWTTNGEQATVSTTTKNVLTVTHHEGAATAGGGANKRHEGWNMLGVPFMSCYTAGTDMYEGEGSTDLMEGRMELSGDPADPYNWETGDVVYVSVPSHDFAEYIQTDITTAKLVPGWSFFVQVGTTGNLTFLTTEQRENSDMPIYAPQREANYSPVVKTGIVLSDGTKSDKTTLLISDKYSSEYEIGADLEKMFGNAFTLSTYSITNGTNLAFNALSTYEAQQAIPVGVRIPADGQYTFSLNQRYADTNIERLDLIDYEAGEVTNLLQADYTFTATYGQNESRFALNVTPIKNTPTDVENGELMNDEMMKVRKVIIDDKMFIIRDGLMFDATGKRVSGK